MADDKPGGGGRWGGRSSLVGMPRPLYRPELPLCLADTTFQHHGQHQASCESEGVQFSFPINLGNAASSLPEALFLLSRMLEVLLLPTPRKLIIGSI